LFVSFAVFIYYFNCISFAIRLSGRKLAIKLIDCRQDAAKRQTAGIKFTHKLEIRFFAPQGRLVAPIHVKLGGADGHVGSFG